MGMKFSPNVSRNDWLRFTKGKGGKKTHPLQKRRFKQRLCFQTGLWTLWMLGIFSVFKLDITWLTRSHWLVDHWQKMTKVLPVSSCSELKRVKFSSALWLQSSTTLTTLGWSHWGATRSWHSRPHLASQKPLRSGHVFCELNPQFGWLVLIPMVVGELTRKISMEIPINRSLTPHTSTRNQSASRAGTVSPFSTWWWINGLTTYIDLKDLETLWSSTFQVCGFHMFPHICPNRRFVRYVPALLYSLLEEYSWNALHLGAWMCCRSEVKTVIAIDSHDVPRIGWRDNLLYIYINYIIYIVYTSNSGYLISIQLTLLYRLI